jgi:hypothetical protein
VVDRWSQRISGFGITAIDRGVGRNRHRKLWHVYDRSQLTHCAKPPIGFV